MSFSRRELNRYAGGRCNLVVFREYQQIADIWVWRVPREKQMYGVYHFSQGSCHHAKREGRQGSAQRSLPKGYK